MYLNVFNHFKYNTVLALNAWAYIASINEFEFLETVNTFIISALGLARMPSGAH